MWGAQAKNRDSSHASPVRLTVEFLGATMVREGKEKGNAGENEGDRLTGSTVELDEGRRGLACRDWEIPCRRF